MNIAVVIVTYNGAKWIEKTIQSLLESTIVPSIIVVDNNSNDSTLNILKKKYREDIHLIQSPVNLGFGKGNNLGIAKALEFDLNYVFLLNQDAMVERSTFEKLLGVAERNPDYGIISPVHMNWEGNKLEEYFAHFMSLNNNSPYFYSDHILGKEIASVYETGFVNAAAWLLPVKVLEEVGGFDPIFWHYGEDNNYCHRILFHNYKIGVVPKTFIQHDSTKRDFLGEKKPLSKKFFIEYEKALKVKYGNINLNLDQEVIKWEKRRILKLFLTHCINLEVTSPTKYLRLYNLIDSIFNEILESRTINKMKGRHYL